MKDHTEEAQAVVNTVKDYLKARQELILLKVVDKSTQIIASTICWVKIAVLAGFSLLFFSIGIGFFLAEKTGSTCLGFLIVGGFYLLMTLIVVFTRKNLIQKPLIDMLIKELLQERNNDRS